MDWFFLIGFVALLVAFFAWGWRSMSKRNPAPDMQGPPRAPVCTGRRVAGGAVSLGVFFAALLVAVALIDELWGSRTAMTIVQPFTYSGFGAAYIGWRWPDLVLRPFERLLAKFKQAR